MKTLLSILVVFLCFAFVGDTTQENNFNLLEGKWEMVATDVNGVRDTTQKEWKVMYYEFNYTTGFTLSYIRTGDSTEYKIGGDYAKNPEKSFVKVSMNDKNKTHTKYTVKDLTADSMKLISKTGEKKETPVEYVNYFARVKQ